MANSVNAGIGLSAKRALALEKLNRAKNPNIMSGPAMSGSGMDYEDLEDEYPRLPGMHHNVIPGQVEKYQRKLDAIDSQMRQVSADTRRSTRNATGIVKKPSWDKAVAVKPKQQKTRAIQVAMKNMY